MAVILPKISLGGAPALNGVPAATDWVTPTVAASGSTNLMGSPIILVPLAVPTNGNSTIVFSLGFAARIVGFRYAYANTGGAADIVTLSSAAGTIAASSVGLATANGMFRNDLLNPALAVVAAGTLLSLAVFDGAGDCSGTAYLECITGA